MFDIYNPTKALRIIYDGVTEISIKPDSVIRGIDLSKATRDRLKVLRGDLVVVPHMDPPPWDRKPMFLTGMLGIGDNIHLRAVLRELKKVYSVKLETLQISMYYDLVDQYLELIPFTHSNIKPRIRESMFKDLATKDYVKLPAHRHRVTYRDINKHGSILASQFAFCNLKMPVKPDFSLPIHPDWNEKLDKLMKNWKIDKPLMIYRPIILNTVWPRPNRSPEPGAYNFLYRSLRDKFFVVSVASLKDKQEWIVGTQQNVDIELNNGQLDFETMAALFARADLVFGNAGFAPVLAQAVGTPVICVYGGNESSKTTNSVGVHLAPSLFIEPDKPCDCHRSNHDCDKRITLPPALKRIQEFVDEHVDFRNNLHRHAEQVEASGSMGCVESLLQQEM